MRYRRLLVFSASLLVLFARTCLAADVTDERNPPPSPSELAKAQKLVQELLGDEIAKTKPAGRAALAAKLLKQADESKDDLAGRFVLLRTARDMAAKAGDPILAAKAADDLAIEYRLSAGAAREPLSALATATMGVDTAHLAADILLAAADTAAGGDDYDPSLSLLKAADTIARKSRYYRASNQVKTRMAQVEKLKADAVKVQASMAKLKENADDPAANLAVGRFLCMAKRDWEAAIPHLAKGAKGPLKEAVDHDIQAVDGDVAAKIAAADDWYDLAAKAGVDFKPCLQLRAYHWYLLAAPKASGLNRAKAEKRIKELQSVAEVAIDKSRTWLHIRRALADQQIKRWQIVGGAFAHNDFEEVPAGGAILIGFRYTVTHDGRLPGVVQAIFLTSSGEVDGKIYGTPITPTETPQVVKAKPGYAVGAIHVRGGGGLDAFQPTFMRIKEKGLDADDSYEGPQVGGNGGGQGTVGGDGNFIVGLHGKINDKGKMEAMSAVTLTTTPPVDDQPPPPRIKRPRKVKAATNP